MPKLMLFYFSIFYSKSTDLSLFLLQIEQITDFNQATQQIRLIDLYYTMSDETFELNRKLRYITKTEDGAFGVKYTIEIDPNNSAMQAAPKSSQPSSQRIKVDNYPDIEQKKTNSFQYKQNQNYLQQRETKNDRDERRNKRMRKKLEFKKDEAEIFRNFNKFNTKKMRIVKDEDEEPYGEVKNYKNKTKYKKQGKYRNKGKNYVSEQSEELDGLYDYLMAPQPVNRKRMSRSIDNTEKREEPTNIQKKMQAFYEDKRNKKAIYLPYANLDDIEDSRDAKENRYFRGTIDFNERVKYYARIFTKEIEGDLIVEGDNKNRCIHGDEVYFEILPKQNPADSKASDGMDEKIRCRVVYILPWKKDQKRQIVGKIQFTRSNKTYYLVPINKRIISFDVKFSEISRDDLKKVNEKYFLAEFTGWKQTQEYPSCKIISEFGEIGQIETETQALLINNGIQDKQYDEETVKQGLDKFLKSTNENGEYKISEEQIKNRSDLRNDMIFTIDPLTAKDFDDALSIIECGVNQKGIKIYEVGVHIADASFFVEEGGLIDERAQQTTTSVYLTHRVLPMLPRVLCETMCSLNPGLERLTVSVWFKVTSEGEVLPGSRYDRSVIKSKARFTYQQAQKIIQKEIKSQKEVDAGFGCVKAEEFDKIAEDLIIMNSIAMKIRDARIKGGSLIFETPKKSFKLDQNLYPIEFSISKRFQANFLVQEYMLLANQKVGEILVENVRSFALLRKHKFPSDKKIEKFQKFTLKINNPIKINKDSPMQQQMNQVMKNPKIKQCIKQVLNYEMIFLLQQAQYFVVGDTPKAEWLHYALNMPVYTHFTSPIRRYPDIMVHRLLIAVINAKRKNLPKDQIELPNFKRLKQTVDRCNKNKITAKKVSSGCEKIFLCLYLKTHPVYCKAVLTDMNQYCLSICVPSYDFRSAIQFKELKKEKVLSFSKDSTQRKYIELQCQYEPGKFTKVILKQMQQIDVRLTAKQGFPIDYMIRLMLPHPKDPQSSIICE